MISFFKHSFFSCCFVPQLGFTTLFDYPKKKKKNTIHIAFLKWHKNSWLTIYVSHLHTFWLCKYSLVSSTAACSQIESPLCVQALLSVGPHNLVLMCPIQALLQLANSSSSSKNVKLLKKKKGKTEKGKKSSCGNAVLCYVLLSILIKSFHEDSC